MEKIRFFKNFSTTSEDMTIFRTTKRAMESPRTPCCSKGQSYWSQLAAFKTTLIMILQDDVERDLNTERNGAVNSGLCEIKNSYI
jgi:hypothetical protein